MSHRVSILELSVALRTRLNEIAPQLKHPSDIESIAESKYLPLVVMLASSMCHDPRFDMDEIYESNLRSMYSQFPQYARLLTDSLEAGVSHLRDPYGILLWNLWDKLEGGDRHFLLRLSLELGMDPNSMSDDCDGSLLLFCCGKRDLEAMRLLLQAGANPNPQADVSGPGAAPLHMAAGQGWNEGVGLLLKYGADPRFENSDGATAIDVAGRCGFDSLAKLLSDYPRGTP